MLGVFEVAAKIRDPRKTRERYREGVGALEQRSHLRARKILRGDDQLLRASAPPIELRNDILERVDRAENRHAINFPADARGRVGEHTDDAIDRARVACHLADKGVGPVLGADQQHRYAWMLGALENVVEAAVLKQPVGEARRAQKGDQHEPVDQQCRSRQRFEAGEHEHHRHEDRHGDGYGAGDIEEIG